MAMLGSMAMLRSMVYGEAEICRNTEIKGKTDYIVFKIGGAADVISHGRAATTCGE